MANQVEFMLAHQVGNANTPHRELQPHDYQHAVATCFLFTSPPPHRAAGPQHLARAYHTDSTHARATTTAAMMKKKRG